jgi:hypothetical protein
MACFVQPFQMSVLHVKANLPDCPAVNGRAVLPRKNEPYDAADYFNRSIDACYAAMCERVRAGGTGWKPR